MKLRAGEATVVPSNLDGDVVFLRGTEGVRRVMGSMCPGTGRLMSRGAAKEIAAGYDFAGLRDRVYILRRASATRPSKRKRPSATAISMPA